MVGDLTGARVAEVGQAEHQVWGRFDDMHIARDYTSDSTISLTERDLLLPFPVDQKLAYDRKVWTYEKCLLTDSHNAYDTPQSQVTKSPITSF